MISMRPRLPTELLDWISNLLHDDGQDALKAYCLVSKAWIYRARRHLFKCIHFQSYKLFGMWKTKFPDPVNSPAIHTRSLFINHAEEFTDADVSWIQSFTEVVQLEVTAFRDYDPNGRPAFSPFHGLSSTVKSLGVVWFGWQSRDVLDFICSFPNLVDLQVEGSGQIRNRCGDWAISGFPPSTRSILLETSTTEFMHQLLDLPIHFPFEEIVWKGTFESDFRVVLELVAKCSDVLARIELDLPAPVDLSKATKLQEAGFWFYNRFHPHIVTTLATINSKHRKFKRVLMYIALSSPDNADPNWAGEQPWKDLDGALVRLWKLHKTCAKVILCPGRDEVEKEMREKQDRASIQRLLPETMRMMEGHGEIRVELERDEDSELPRFPNRPFLRYGY